MLVVHVVVHDWPSLERMPEEQEKHWWESQEVQGWLYLEGQGWHWVAVVL